MRNGAVIGAFVIVVAACVGDDPGATSSSSSGGASSGNTSSSGGSSGASGDGGPCTAGEKSCDGDKLRTCKGDGTFDSLTCTTGCIAGPPAHCKRIVPSANGVTSADLDGDGLMPVIVTVTATLDTDTGEISNGVRGANVDPTKREVINGIAFHTTDIPGTTGKKIGVFSFAKLSIGDGKKITAIGTNALAIASATDILLAGQIDMRGTCAASAGGPGGGNGGKVGVPPTGGDPLGAGKNGVSNSSDTNSGGSGGGYGDSGGNGTRLAPANQQTNGGLNYGNEKLVPLLGGSGGGRGGDGNSAAQSSGGAGGGGGGAIMMIAVEKITIGGSTFSGINAGGCGGQGGTIMASTSGTGCGGGGGSGGAILIEAPDVKLDVEGSLVANGGAGGGGANSNGGGTAQAGTAGAFTWNQTGTHGSMPLGTGCGAGGFGGASNDVASTPDSTNKGENGALGGTGYCGGGGGGGVGRIRINTRSGTMVIVDASGLVSPKFEDTSSHAEKPATQGKIVEE